MNFILEGKMQNAKYKKANYVSLKPNGYVELLYMCLFDCDY